VFEAESWQELVAILVGKRIDVAVIDPGAAGCNQLESTIDLLRGFPGIPVLVYMTASADAPAVIMALNAHHVRHIVLHRYEGSVSTFRDELLRTTSDHLSSRFLGAFSGPFEKLLDCLRMAVREMLDRPHRFQTAGDIALHANVPLHKMHREFELAGIGSPKKMLIAARLLRAHTYLSTFSRSVKSTAAMLGYRDPYILRRHVEAAFRVDSRTFGMLRNRQVIDGLNSWMLACDRSTAD